MGEDFRITSGESVVGSDWSSHVVLTGGGVSGRHALLRWNGDHLLLRDLESASGTNVRGEPVRECPLDDLDIIRFGELTFRLRLARADRDAAQKAALGASRPSLSRPSQEAAQKKRQVRGWLLVVQGEQLGLDFRLLDGRNRIGRELALELTLIDRVAALWHANVLCDAETTWIEPADSRNELLVNREPCRGRALVDSDLVQVGNTTLLYKTIGVA